MTLATNVLNVRYSFSTTPRRMVFISGIPEPGKENEMRPVRKREKKAIADGGVTGMHEDRGRGDGNGRLIFIEFSL